VKARMIVGADALAIPRNTYVIRWKDLQSESYSQMREIGTVPRA